MKLLRLALFISLALVLLVGLVLSVRVYLDPSVRAGKFLLEARVLEDKGLPDQAMAEYRRAADKDPRSVASVLPYLERARGLNKEEFSRRTEPLVEKEYIYPNQLRRLIEVARRVGDQTRLAQFARRLLAEFPGESGSLTLAADSFFAAGELPRAAGLYEAAIQADPNNRQAKLHYAQLLVRTGQPVQQIRAKVFLKQASQGDDEAALRASLSLLTHPEFDLLMEERETQLQVLAQHPMFSSETEFIVSNETLIRALAAQFAVIDTAAAYKVSSWLMQQESTEEDMVFHIYLAQRLGKITEARDLLASGSKENPSLIALRAHQAVLTNRVPEGIQILQDLLDANPGNPQALNILLLIKERNAAEDGWLSPDEEIAVNNRILLHPRADLPARLDAVGRLLTLQPLRRERVVETASRVLADYQINLAAYLLQTDREQDALTVLREGTVESNPELARLRVLALIAVNRAADAQAFMENVRDIPELERLILNVLIELALNNADAARQQWDRAFAIARSRGGSNHLLTLARSGMQFRDGSSAEAAFKEALNRGASLGEGDWLNYFTLALRREDMAEARSIAQRMVNAFPNNAVFINNAAYLDLLGKRELARSLRVLQEASEKNPDFKSMKITLSLAYLLNGSPREALAEIDRARIDWDSMPPASRAVYAVVLAANNQGSLARALAGSIDQSGLLPAERELVASVLR